VRTWPKSSLYAAVTLVAVGFLLLFFAWNGAASKDFIQGQFPYLLSGGLTGLGCILCGLALAVTQSFRRDLLTLGDKLDELLEQQRANASSGGAAPALSAVPDAVADGALVATGTTYHLPSCRTVRGRAGLDLVSIEQVEERGLAACRVCRPAAARTA
jgi:hypothetical protein